MLLLVFVCLKSFDLFLYSYTIAYHFLHLTSVASACYRVLCNRSHKNTELSKALLTNGKYGKYTDSKRGKDYSSRGHHSREYGYSATDAGYGDSMNANSYSLNSHSVAGNANSADSNNTINSANANSQMSGIALGASGQYSNLPQTGNTENYAVLALGLATISLSFGLAGTRRKRG